MGNGEVRAAAKEEGDGKRNDSRGAHARIGAILSERNKRFRYRPMVSGLRRYHFEPAPELSGGGVAAPATGASELVPAAGWAGNRSSSDAQLVRNMRPAMERQAIRPIGS